MAQAVGAEESSLALPSLVDLVAVLVAVTQGEPKVLTIRQGTALPSGPFQQGHRSLQSGLRAWVEQQTGHPLGYVEQLYTFADRDRTGEDVGEHMISISYLGLTREDYAPADLKSNWRSWYEYFPWEDHRQGVPEVLSKVVQPQLEQWIQAARDPAERKLRARRIDINFGFGAVWNEELVLQRYELLYEAGLVFEAINRSADTPAHARLGRSMIADHRRILATGISRLRAKIKYRPVVFELMRAAFTLLQLQRTVEALAGLTLHKQNFRRLIEQQQLVEETGEMDSTTGGRPAKLFRFRHEILAERAAVSAKLPVSRT